VTAVEHDEQAPWLQRRDVGGEVSARMALVLTRLTLN
jgi:hypothetical protein